MTIGSLRVLTYHRVSELSDSRVARPASVSATPDSFDRQMKYLTRCFSVVSAGDVLESVRSDRSLPSRAVLVTFDDAYEDFGDVAWPILRRYGVPVTLFVPTSYPDAPEREFWWDRLYRVFANTDRQEFWVPSIGHLAMRGRANREEALRRIEREVKSVPHDKAVQLVDDVCTALGDNSIASAPVLGWDALRELARMGVTLAPHTRTHPVLSQLPAERAREEIAGSRDDLIREIGGVLPIFAYPYGAFNDTTVSVVRDCGFELALTCHDGSNDMAQVDPLRLRRTNISQRTGDLLFRARLTAVGAALDRWRHRHERDLLPDTSPYAVPAGMGESGLRVSSSGRQP